MEAGMNHKQLAEKLIALAEQLLEEDKAWQVIVVLNARGPWEINDRGAIVAPDKQMAFLAAYVDTTSWAAAQRTEEFEEVLEMDLDFEESIGDVAIYSFDSMSAFYIVGENHSDVLIVAKRIAADEGEVF